MTVTAGEVRAATEAYLARYPEERAGLGRLLREPAHWHVDFLHAFSIASASVTLQEAEVTGVRWAPISQLAPGGSGGSCSEEDHRIVPERGRPPARSRPEAGIVTA